jgi:hypothetical protein
MNTPETFRIQMAALTSQLAGRPLDGALDSWLNAEHGLSSSTYREVRQACEDGVSAGWLCPREAAGIRYGRIFKPAPDLHGFSVDVVDMNDIAGPHHVHPQGEIDLVMPLDPEVRFDNRPGGSQADGRWCSTSCRMGRSSSHDERIPSKLSRW